MRQLESNWASRFSEVSEAASLHLQELNLQDNELAEFDDIFKGFMRRSLSSVDRAVEIFDSWTSGTALLMDAKPLVHPPRRWPSWAQLMFGMGSLIILGALTYALLFTPAGSAAGASLAEPGVDLFLSVAVGGIALLLVVVFRKRLERPVTRT